MSRYVLPVYVVVCLVGLAWYAAVRPYHNWDMIPYVGATRALSGIEPGVLHKNVYKDLRLAVSLETFGALTEGPHRGVVYENSEAFRQQLPFYQPRVLYIATVYLLALVGVDVFAATHIVSAIAVAGGLLLLLAAFRSRIRSGLLFLVPPFAALLGLLDTAKYSTPDGLAFLVMSLAVYLFLRGHRTLFAVLPLCVLVRTDLILFVVVVTMYFWLSQQSRVLALIGLAASAILAVGLSASYSYYEPAAVYYNTFVGALTYPAEFTGSYRLSDHLGALETGVLKTLSDRAFLIFVAMSTTLAAISYRSRRLRDVPRLRFLVGSSLLFVVIHFVLFPEIEARFFVLQYMLVLLVLLSVLSDRSGDGHGGDAVDLS